MYNATSMRNCIRIVLTAGNSKSLFILGHEKNERNFCTCLWPGSKDLFVARFIGSRIGHTSLSACMINKVCGQPAIFSICSFCKPCNSLRQHAWPNMSKLIHMVYMIPFKNNFMTVQNRSKHDLPK